jgi:RNA-directed DNA polymerase
MNADYSQMKEDQPASVPTRARQAGEVRARWAWTEPSVWTDRMLAALERGLEGGVWFSLWDKVWRLENLRSAFAKVRANAGASGVDHQSVDEYDAGLESNLQHLSEQLKGGKYRPAAIRRVYIPKPGTNQKRPLGIPTVRDRVVQGAMRQVLEPIFERTFAEHSYGFRPGRSCHGAIHRVEELLAGGHYYVVDADLKSYFDTIPHDRLMQRMRRQVADGSVLNLLESFLRQPVLEELEHWTPDEGCPQGAVLSPLLSNIYLNDLDHEMAGAGMRMVRYADDFVILCRSEKEAQEALERVRRWTIQEGLTLHPEKTRIVDVRVESFDFLGYRFERNSRRPSRKSAAKLQDSIRQRTRTTEGRSMPIILTDLNRRLNGWFNYFRHCTKGSLAWVDRWVRTRLRGILRRRRGRRGCARNLDAARWPNAYFAMQGLFSLEAAHLPKSPVRQAVKSSTGEPCAGNPPARFGGGRGRI